MTTKLLDGDFATNKYGHLLPAVGSDEIIERALIRLRVKKGSFVFNKELGSELHLLDLNSTDENQLMAVVCDALSPIQEVQVTEVKRLISKDADSLSLSIDLLINQNKSTITLS